MKLLHLGPMRIYRVRAGLEFYAGPWAANLSWGPGRFGWRAGDGAIVRFIRRWWTGWHRWQDEPWPESSDVYLAFSRDEAGNPINVRPVDAEPLWEDDRIIGYVVPAAPPSKKRR